MKKAKIILASIAFLAVIGGSFAFKAMRTSRQAYTYTAGTTWSSTTIGTRVYSTTVPVCIPLTLLGSTLYVSNAGINAPDIYTTTLATVTFTAPTVGGTLTTTFLTKVCDPANPIANTLVTTIF